MKEIDGFPHNGLLVEKVISERTITKTSVAKKIDVTVPTLLSYIGRQSIQAGNLWKLSLALEHNFLLELGSRLPVKFVTPAEEALLKEIDELKKQITALEKESEQLRIENSVYKEIVKR